MNKLKNPIFFQLTKINLDNRTVEGIATAEVEDHVGETCHYETTKPYYEKWSKGVQKASGGKSLGNVRAMHSNIAAGILTDIQFDDAAKSINVVAEIVDDAEWNKCVKGCYTGFSQGGAYVKIWEEDGKKFYTADPGEISIVDMPCLGVSTFKAVKSDGTFEMMKFADAPAGIAAPELEQVWKAKDGSIHTKKADAEAHNATLAADPALVKKTERIEKRAAIGALAKDISSTWDAMTAINALCSIEWLHMNEAMEAEEGDDEAQQVADLQAVIERLKTFIASEITEDLKTDGTLERMMKMVKALEPDESDHVKSMHKKSLKIMDHAHKAMQGDGDAADHMKKIHAHATDIAEKCSKMIEAPKGDAMDAESAKKIDALTTDNAALTKQLGELSKASTDTSAAMREQIEALSKRLKAVEDQPVPPKGSISAVAKGHEVVAGDSAVKPVEVVTIEKSILTENGMSSADLRARRRGQ